MPAVLSSTLLMLFNLNKAGQEDFPPAWISESEEKQNSAEILLLIFIRGRFFTSESQLPICMDNLRLALVHGSFFCFPPK